MPICRPTPGAPSSSEHALPGRRHHPDQGLGGLAALPRPPLDLRQAGRGAVPGPRRRPPRRHPAALPGVLQAHDEPAQHGRRQPAHPRPRDLPSLDEPRPFLVHAADRRPCQHRRRHRQRRGRWWRHATGATAPGGTFDHWHIHAEPMPDIEDWCGTWARKHLAGYTGMINFETIGSRIIEAHLRFADQWPDLYGPGWVEALVRPLRQQRLDLRRQPTAPTATASCCSPRTAQPSTIPRNTRSTRPAAIDGRLQRADLLPPGPRPVAALHAARRLPPRHHQRHRPRRRPPCPRHPESHGCLQCDPNAHAA